MKKDTIEVRADERFDEVKLADYLRGQLPGSENPLTVRQFGGGAANLTYLLGLWIASICFAPPAIGAGCQIGT